MKYKCDDCENIFDGSTYTAKCTDCESTSIKPFKKGNGGGTIFEKTSVKRKQAKRKKKRVVL